MEDKIFVKHLALIGLFFLVTPLVIITSLISLISLKVPKNHTKSNSHELNIYQYPKSGVSVYASLPSALPTVSGVANISDGRSELLKNYLNFYHSPLEKYAQELVTSADMNILDYRLLTAIAQQESNLCKVMPSDTYNCWGWGIHSKGTLAFESYLQAIETVSKGIKQEYIDKGFVTIDEIMSKYTPLSNGSWSEGVIKFMAEIEDVSYF